MRGAHDEMRARGWTGAAPVAPVARPSALVVLFSIDLGVLIACRSLLGLARVLGGLRPENETGGPPRCTRSHVHVHMCCTSTDTHMCMPPTCFCRSDPQT